MVERAPSDVGAVQMAVRLVERYVIVLGWLLGSGMCRGSKRSWVSACGKWNYLDGSKKFFEVAHQSYGRVVE
jgi:hypothetical protein